MPENDDLKNLPARVAGMNEPDRVYSNSLERAGRVPMIYGGGGGEDQGNKGEFSLRDILYVLFRHKWKIVFTSLLLACGTVFYIASIPPMFESEARVLIRGDRTGLTVDPTGEGNSFIKASRDGGSVRTEIGIMTSQMLAEQVVDKLGAEAVLGGVTDPNAKPKSALASDANTNPLLAKALNGIESGVHWSMAKLHLLAPKMTLRQVAVQSIVKGLDVAPTMSESYVLRVAYRAPTPETARQVLDALVDAYQQKHIDLHKAVAPEFFQGKLVDLKKELTEKENSLAAERKRLNIASLETEKANLLNREVMYETALKENVMRISSLKAKVGQLEQLSSKRLTTSKGGKKSVPVRTSNPLVEQLRARLIEMKLRESDMASRFTDRNPELIDVRAQIKSLERQIVDAMKSPGDSTGIDPIADADPTRSEIELQTALAKVDLEAEAAREGMLMKELDTVQKDKAKLMANETELKRKEREVEILDQEYKRYLTSMQTADISATLDKDKISNVSIVQRATLPTEPAKSQRKLLALLGFGLFMSLIAGVGWAFGLEFCDHSIKTNEDVERQLGLPVLVAIPYNKHHKALLQEENS